MDVKIEAQALLSSHDYVSILPAVVEEWHPQVCCFDVRRKAGRWKGRAAQGGNGILPYLRRDSSACSSARGRKLTLTFDPVWHHAHWLWLLVSLIVWLLPLPHLPLENFALLGSIFFLR